MGHDLLERIRLQHCGLFGRNRDLVGVSVAWQSLDPDDRISPIQLLSGTACALDRKPLLVVVPVQSHQELAELLELDSPLGDYVELADSVGNDEIDSGVREKLTERGIRLIRRSCVGATSLVDSTDSGLAGKDSLESSERIARNIAQMEAAFKAEAELVSGWPVQNQLPLQSEGPLEADVSVALDLMNQLGEKTSIDVIEPLLQKSPTLTFRLLAFLNSGACGVANEVHSVRHAVMLLGFDELRRWVSALIVGAVDNPKVRPLLHASIRRAFFLQEVADCIGQSDARNDMFICGSFSMLDQITGQPMSELLARVSLSENVQNCLARREGPLAPYLDLACQVEVPGGLNLASACDATATTAGEVNNALLRSLYYSQESGMLS